MEKKTNNNKLWKTENLTLYNNARKLNLITLSLILILQLKREDERKENQVILAKEESTVSSISNNFPFSGSLKDWGCFALLFRVAGIPLQILTPTCVKAFRVALLIFLNV